MKYLENALVIDAGNTRIKVALFQFADLKEVHAFSNDQLTELKNFLQAYTQVPAIIASVRSEKSTAWMMRLVPKAIRFHSQLKLPVHISYETPETLGVDRIANAIAAHQLAHQNALVIDVGTCVKYDFIDEDGFYFGGAISPGIELRYKAMHTFTGKLPLIEDRNNAPIIGRNTLEAMRSGVINGMHREINGFMEEYRSLYPQLTIFLTGGDAQYFEFEPKNGIFADENLTLKGLLIALIHVHA